MKKLIFLLFLIGYTAFAQDTIIKINGDVVVSKIVEIRSDEVSYKKFSNLDGPAYRIQTKEIAEIIFENGTSENFIEAPKNQKTLEETKSFLVRMIEQHCFERGSDVRRYRAAFEGDFLRLQVMNKKGTSPVNGGLLWDFGQVHEFHRVSKREVGLAFINIWLNFISDEEKGTRKKNKLVIQVAGHDEADQIVLALKHLNKLLVAEKTPVERF